MCILGRFLKFGVLNNLKLPSALERFPKEMSRSDVSFGEFYRAGGATPVGTKTERSLKESLGIALLLSAWSAGAAQVER